MDPTTVLVNTTVAEVLTEEVGVRLVPIRWNGQAFLPTRRAGVTCYLESSTPTIAPVADGAAGDPCLAFDFGQREAAAQEFQCFDNFVRRSHSCLQAQS
jgi:hypothetical protein